MLPLSMFKPLVVSVFVPLAAAHRHFLVPKFEPSSHIDINLNL